MPVGTVKFFNESKGYGFIQPDGGGTDAFVHITAVESAGMRTLRENQRVGYDLEADRRGKMAATNLRAADEAEAGEATAANDDAEADAEVSEAADDSAGAGEAE